MKATNKGQVTLPAELRTQYGIGPNDDVECVGSEEGIVIRLAKPRGKDIINRMTLGGKLPGSTNQILKQTRG